MAPRTELDIALDPTGSVHGSVRFWIPRDSWPGGEIPINDTIIALINSIAKAEGKPVLPRYIPANHEVVDVPYPTTEDSHARTPLSRIIADKRVDSSRNIASTARDETATPMDTATDADEKNKSTAVDPVDTLPVS